MSSFVFLFPKDKSEDCARHRLESGLGNPLLDDPIAIFARNPVLGHQMSHQCLLVLEGEPTQVALLGPVISVVDHVLLQGAEVGNILSTHGARETT